MRDGGTTKISVLLCAYNPVREQLLSAVRSITDQTVSSWEMLLVDDGSAPSYEPLFREAAASDPRVRLLRRDENSGLAMALNDAIAEAKSPFLARMDADDISEPERLQREVDFLEGHDEYMWVGSNAWLMDGEGRWGQRVLPERPEANDFLKYSPYIHSSVMFRAEVFARCGGYHPLRRGEDYELFMRFHAGGMRGYNLQENLLAYWEDTDSYRRRDFPSRLEEVGIRREGFRSMGIRSALRPFYVIKPVFVACVPRGMQERRKRRIGKESYVR